MEIIPMSKINSKSNPTVNGIKTQTPTKIRTATETMDLSDIGAGSDVNS
jgi:hypothetical protein